MILKKIQNYWPVLPFLALAFFMTSCDDVVDVKLNTVAPYLVVDGNIDDLTTTDDTISLSTTIGYTENRPLPPVTNAIVTLTGPDGIPDTLPQPAPGKYVAHGFGGLIGMNYRLDIDWENNKYQAEAVMPRGTHIDSLVVIERKDEPFYQDGYYLKLYGPEPAGVGDYYEVKMRKNDTIQNLPQDLGFTSDELVDGQYIDGIDLNFQPYKKGDRITGYLRAITKDAYYFYLELANNVFQGGLFSAPPSNVRTNVRNLNPESDKRATGYFFVTKMALDSLTI